MNSAPEALYGIPDSVVTREIAGETLLVPISGDLADMDNIFALNETGAFIWARLNGETPLNGIRDALCEAFEVSPEMAWEDLRELLDALENAGLVHQVSD